MVPRAFSAYLEDKLTDPLPGGGVKQAHHVGVLRGDPIRITGFGILGLHARQCQGLQQGVGEARLRVALSRGACPVPHPVLEPPQLP